MSAADPPGTPAEAFAALVERRGIGARPLGLLVRLLGEGAPFDELVRRTALPRRAVEEALGALDGDVEEAGGDLRLRAGAAAAYAGVAALAPCPARSPGPWPRPGDDAADGAAAPAGLPADVAATVGADLLATVGEAIATAPRARRELDHVSATPATVARRAAWLAGTFALSGRRVLCLGDHDLTAVALAALDPSIDVTVADMDEGVLAHASGFPATAGRIRAAFADFRLGLPAGLRGAADLVVTDPPYTPDGVALFARRGLEALADHGTGRLVVAYGYGDQPGLGLAVQEALAGLKLAYEAVLPAFNHYQGAQAIGSASSLYVLRPTAGTRRAVAAAGRRGAPANVYTHGPQSTEGGSGPLAPATLAALVEVATAGGYRLALAVGDAWPEGWPGTGGGAAGGATGAVRRATLAHCLAPESPEVSPCAAPPDPGTAAVADLRHDAGPLLLRLLLATRAPRAAVLVRNDHPDIADAAGQAALAGLLAGAVALRFRRSTPGPRLAIVEATRLPAPGPVAPVAPAPDSAAARRHVLDRPHAKLANSCRDALVRAVAPAGAGPLTRNQARALVAEHLPPAGVDPSLTLLELPRARFAALFAAIEAAHAAAQRR
jgi:hypothetical protein